jgi:hypothetical protein
MQLQLPQRVGECNCHRVALSSIATEFHRVLSRVGFYITTEDKENANTTEGKENAMQLPQSEKRMQ